MKLYAVIVDNLGTRQAHAVRATSPAAAVDRLLDDGDVVHFKTIAVELLSEELIAELAPDVSEDETTS